MPKESSPSFIRTVLFEHVSHFANAATVGPDFNANTLVTAFGGAGGYSPGFVCYVEQLQFAVGPEDSAGAGGTLTFELRKNSATGTALASLTVALAAALRGVTLKAAVSAANSSIARLIDTDTLFLVRIATGTAFTTARGTFSVIARQPLQPRI